MKKFTLVLISLALLASCNNNKENSTFFTKLNDFKFDYTTFNSFEVFESSLKETFKYDEDTDKKNLISSLEEMLDGCEYFYSNPLSLKDDGTSSLSSLNDNFNSNDYPFDEEVETIDGKTITLNYNIDTLSITYYMKLNKSSAKALYIDNESLSNGFTMLRILNPNKTLISSNEIDVKGDYEFYIKLDLGEKSDLFDKIITQYTE